MFTALKPASYEDLVEHFQDHINSLGRLIELVESGYLSESEDNQKVKDEFAKLKEEGNLAKSKLVAFNAAYHEKGADSPEVKAAWKILKVAFLGFLVVYIGGLVFITLFITSTPAAFLVASFIGGFIKGWLVAHAILLVSQLYKEINRNSISMEPETYKATNKQYLDKVKEIRMKMVALRNKNKDGGFFDKLKMNHAIENLGQFERYYDA
jgi:hypothetical protein